MAIDQIKNLPDISFIDNITLDDVMTGMINYFQDKYKELTGTEIVLNKADPNRLLINTFALYLYQGYLYIDRAGKLNLLKYSYGEFLENLGAWKGVTKSEAKEATVKVTFTLSEVRSSDVTIPSGTRVTAAGIYFETTEDNIISAGETSITITMKCTEAGTIGNDIEIGEIVTLVKPLNYTTSVVNITKSSGGEDEESDDSFAGKIFLAPSSYSVAGPDDAYVYWVKTFSTEILDVSIDVPDACQIAIYFILQDGELPDAEMIAGLETYITDKKIKPQTDLVTVSAPTVVEYSLNLTYYIDSSNSTSAVSIQTQVASAISDYISWQGVKIGRDINPSELTKRVMAAGAKRVEITSPVFTVINDKTEIASLVSQSVTYGGVE